MPLRIVGHDDGVPAGQVCRRIGDVDHRLIDDRASTQHGKGFRCLLFRFGEDRRGDRDGGMVDAGYRIGARRKDLQLDPVVDLGTDLASPGVYLVDELDRVHVQAGAHHCRARVDPQLERGDHSEEARPRSACGPVHVGVVLGVAVDLFAVGGHDLQPENALHAGRSPAVPAVATL